MVNASSARAEALYPLPTAGKLPSPPPPDETVASPLERFVTLYENAAVAELEL